MKFKMAKMVELSFDIRGVLDSGFSAAFHNAGRLMQELQNKSSSLSKTMSQVGNYKKLEDGIKADQAALADMSAKSADLNSKLQAVSSQTAILKTQFNSAQGEAVRSQAALSLNRERYAAITEEVARLKNELNIAPSDELKRKLSAAELEAVKLGNAVAKDTAKFKEADLKAKNLNKSLKSSENQQRALTRESQNLAGKTERLQQSLQRKKSALDELHPSLQKAGVDTRNLAAEQERLAKKSQTLAASQAKLQEAQIKYTAARQQLSLGNLKGELISSLAGFEILKQPLKVAANFEQAIARVDAVTFGGKNYAKKSTVEREQLAALKTQAENLGASTQFTAVEAATSQELLARAGFKAPEIINAMPGLLDMAAAEGMDLATAADVMASSLRGFNLDAKEAGRVADVLAKASLTTNTSIVGLGESLKYVAPVAQGLGMKIEDTVAILGSMANAGIKGTQAGTATRAILERLVKPPKEARSALAALNIPVLDKKGRLRDLPGLMLDLAKATEKMGEGKRMAYLEAIFGKEPSAAALAVMNEAKSKTLQTSTQDFYNARGTSRNMAEIINNTYVGDTTKFSSAVEGFFNLLGSEYIPLAREGVQKLTDWVSSFTGFLKENPAASKATAIGTAGFAGFSFVKLITKVAAGVKNLASASAQIHAATSAAGTAASAGTVTTAATTAATAGTTAASTAATTGTIAAGSGGILSALGLGALYSLSAGVIAAGIHGIATNDKNFREATKNFSVMGTEIGGWGALANKYKPVENPVDLKKIQDAEAVNKNESINKILDAAIEQKNKSAGFMDTVTPVINELNIQEKLTAKRDEMGRWSSQLIESMRNSEYAIKDLPERLRPILELLRDQSTPIMIIQNNTPPQAVMPSWSKSPFMNGGISAHASGGIFSTPHIGLVAEAGKEAIVPLENKTRGIPLWLAAGEEMGLSFGGTSYSVNNNTNKPEYIINITVNGDSTGESEVRMKRMIVDVLREIEEREAMVSYK